MQTKSKKKFNLNSQWLMNNAIYIVLVVLLIGICIISPDFLSLKNFINILSQSSSRI